jgi:hypothetical protein
VPRPNTPGALRYPGIIAKERASSIIISTKTGVCGPLPAWCKGLKRQVLAYDRRRVAMRSGVTMSDLHHMSERRRWKLLRRCSPLQEIWWADRPGYPLTALPYIKSDALRQGGCSRAIICGARLAAHRVLPGV